MGRPREIASQNNTKVFIKVKRAIVEKKGTKGGGKEGRLTAHNHRFCFVGVDGKESG